MLTTHSHNKTITGQGEFGEFLKPPKIDTEGLQRRFDLAALSIGGLEKQAPRNTLRIMRARWRELESINPDYFVGATVFGSSVKGRMHANSDIDTCIFVNPDAIAPVSLTHADVQIILEYFASDVPVSDDNGSERDVKVSLPLILEVNKTIICDEIEDLIDQSNDAWTRLISFTSPGITMFMLSLGSSPDKTSPTLNDMRKNYLDQLSSYGSKGDEVYEKLIDRLRKNEEHYRDADIYLPPTIERARMYWNL